MNRSTLTRRSKDELITSQAIKNNQDFIYATNVAINLLRDEIKTLKLQFEKERAERGSEIQTVKIHIENAIDGVIHDMASFDASQTEFGHRLKKNDLEINCLTTLYKSVHEANQSMEKSYDFVKHTSIDQVKLHEKCKELIKSHFEYLLQQIKSSSENLRRELTVVEPEINPLEVRLNEQIDIMKNDHRGVFKEISILKKTVEYGEKKFEAIFSKIGMKKAGEE